KGDGRLSGQACWHSKDVVQIHGDGIVHLLTHRKSCGGRCRSENDVDLLEGLSEVPRDEGAHLPRLVVVGIIVASGENIGADEDAPFHLVPETGPPSYFLHLVQI